MPGIEGWSKTDFPFAIHVCFLPPSFQIVVAPCPSRIKIGLLQTYGAWLELPARRDLLDNGVGKWPPHRPCWTNAALPRFAASRRVSAPTDGIMKSL